jgi:5,10-methylenetetrahydrofolate reductase
MIDAHAEPASHLERLLREGRFCVTVEVVPPRSADPDVVTAQAEALVGVADAVNVTDNPTARVHMSPIVGAALVARVGLEPVLQLTCRDRNRMALSSDLLGAWALGASNLLALSGDPAGVGDHPDAKTVFDVGVLDLVRLAAGLRRDGTLLSGDRIEHAPRYFVGVADAPLMEGYDFGRLEAKADAGARFVQTQIVFDADALAGWARGARRRGLLDRLSVLAGIAVPRSAAAARLMASFPGVVVPSDVIDRLERAGPDGQEDEGTRIAGELIAAVRAIPGIAGVHLMGLGHPETVGRATELGGLGPRRA